MTRLVSPDTLIPIGGKIKDLAREVTGAQTGSVAKAKAAYDYLFTTMRYDKTGSGWGRGDAIWACDTKRGNCTDTSILHSSAGCGLTEFLPASTSAFLCPKTRPKAISRLSLLG